MLPGVRRGFFESAGHAHYLQLKLPLPELKAAILGHADPAESDVLKKAIWSDLADHRDMPEGLGAVPDGGQSDPLAVTQLILLYHLVQALQG